MHPLGNVSGCNKTEGKSEKRPCPPMLHSAAKFKAPIHLTARLNADYMWKLSKNRCVGNTFSQITSLCYTWVGSWTGCMLCASTFDRLDCLVCLLSQLGYVAGFQTEHVLAWSKLNAALPPPPRIQCNADRDGRGRTAMRRCSHLRVQAGLSDGLHLSKFSMKTLKNRRENEGCS